MDGFVVNKFLRQIGYITVRSGVSCEKCGGRPKAVLLHKGKHHVYCQTCFEKLKPPKDISISDLHRKEDSL
jgi:hypothetical protein